MLLTRRLGQIVTRCSAASKGSARSSQPYTYVRGTCLPRCARSAQPPLGRYLSVVSVAQAQASSSNTPDMIGLYPDRIVTVSVNELDPLSCKQWRGDLLVLCIFEEALSSAEADGAKKITILDKRLQQLDSDLDQYITELISLHEFSAKEGTSCFARFGGNARVVGLVGLGPVAKAQAVVPWGKSPFQEAGAAAAVAAAAHKAATAAIAIIPADGASPSVVETAEKLALGVILGNYKATRHKAKPQRSTLTEVAVLAPGLKAADLARAADVAQGVLLARSLVESPANLCTPQYMADAARSVADSAPGCMQLKVLEREDCEKMGMGLYLGVAECSALPPKFIHLTYTPEGSSKKTIALVGKGLTFDSGGYNLKVGGMIEMMKFDMGGGGAVLGAAQIIAALKPAGVTIHFISASCENMIDGKGMRPGDILTSASGKTVEIDNTDAEGRLTLADALWYAQNKCQAEAMVDIATLTGACMIALGKQVAGLFTPNDSMADTLTAASRNSGEKIWRMPMEQTYFKNLDSSIADMKNTGIGNRYGSAITASLFLKEFVDTSKVEWAHVDIAGPAWREEEGGATGYGAHMLAEWAIAQGQ